VRIAEQRGSDAQALTHAEGKPARPPAGHPMQPDQIEDLVDSGPTDAVAQREAQQMVGGAAPTVHRPGLQQCPHLEHWAAIPDVGAAVDGDPSFGWRVQPQNQTHGRRLPGTIRA